MRCDGCGFTSARPEARFRRRYDEFRNLLRATTTAIGIPRAAPFRASKHPMPIMLADANADEADHEDRV